MNGKEIFWVPLVFEQTNRGEYPYSFVNNILKYKTELSCLGPKDCDGIDFQFNNRLVSLIRVVAIFPLFLVNIIVKRTWCTFICCHSLNLNC